MAQHKLTDFIVQTGEGKDVEKFPTRREALARAVELTAETHSFHCVVRREDFIIARARPDETSVSVEMMADAARVAFSSPDLNELIRRLREGDDK